MEKAFVDYHSHLLPAIDDGAVDFADSLEMARVLVNFGFSTVHCTPHLIRGGFENPPQRVRLLVDALQKHLQDAQIPLTLVPGTEHYFDEYLSEMLPGALTVGASGYLLVEVPFRANGDLIPSLVALLRSQRLLPLFAHPERCHAFQPALRDEGILGALSSVLGRRREPDLTGSLVLELKQMGCKFQGNIGSFAGVYGSVIKQRAIMFLKNGVYCCLGSDAHTWQGLDAILASGIDTIVATVGQDEAKNLLKGSLERP